MKMKHTEAIQTSRELVLTPDDKFDRHMEKAKVTDMESRRTIFDRQVESGIDRKREITLLKSSIY